MKKIIVGIAAAVLVAFAAFYFFGRQKEPITATSFKLNTIVKVTIYDSQNEELSQEAMALCDEYEKIFSRTLAESELYRLNHGELSQENGVVTLSEPLAELVEKGLFYSELSQGAFDVSIEPVSSLWDFVSGEKQIPDEKEIKEALPLVQYQNVRLSGRQLQFAKEGMGLDLGAIAKGYIADKMKEYLVSQGVKSAIIDLGGNVLCIGRRPDQKPFRIGIQRPFADRSETVATVEISDQSVVSAGIYERYFEKDGRLYHHILNPKTGYPYDNDLASVTIISDKSADGDGLSTSCFALGLEKGMELVDSLEGVYGVFLTTDGELHFTEGLEEEFALAYAEGQG